MASASFCQSCGTAISPGTQFCPSCGQRVGASQPLPAISASAFPGPGTSPRPAGFWLRVVALIFDQLIIGVPALIATPFGNAFLGTPFIGPYLLGVFVVWPWLYFAVMESSSKQATLGKLILGLVVSDTAHQRIGFGKASGRHFGKLLAGAILGIGFLMVGITDRKQGLHDLMAGTLVIRKASMQVAG